jgi:predicted DNA-binding protein
MGNNNEKQILMYEILNTECKTKLNTKNDCFVIRVNSEWKNKVKNISESLGISSSVFIRESVNKNINSFHSNYH